MKKLTTLITAMALSLATFAIYADSHQSYEGLNYKNERMKHHGDDKKDVNCHHGSMNYKDHKTTQEERQTKMEKRIQYKVEKMTKKLDLNAVQQQQLAQILKQKAEKKSDLNKETKQQIKAILNPEQIQKMQHFKKS